MAPAAGTSTRVFVDGKFFRLGSQKFFIKGVAYGPFAPNDQQEPFANPEQTRRDFEQIRELGANVLRIYDLPPVWFLDLAADMELKLFVDIPWTKQVCFLDSEKAKNEAREAIRRAAEAGAGQAAVFALSVVNEVPPDIVRWSGAAAIEDFVDELITLAKSIDPDCLCTFGNFPPVEYLRPKEIDFVCFNLYLHHQKPYENYLARLQMIAETKPLILGELGIDSLSEGEDRQCQMLGWQLESAFRHGLAGAVVYSFSDEWFKDGREVTDWGFGLTNRSRQVKPSFGAVQKAYGQAPYFPLGRYPKVSVVVACYNGARTLKACLESLTQLRYPDYEVILVDDGSTDDTPSITKAFPKIRYLHHVVNLGLSAARNTGIAASTGEIVAFTDADCRADEDWLYYLMGDLINSHFAGIGGHNLLPPEDSCVAAAVMMSPGGPAPVLLSDHLAEHIPGCNMAFYRWVLEELGEFDPLFKRAGDDVDICWRLQQLGHEIGFSPAGFVWHYRRSTITEYLKQQRGYGEAEALLVRKHPEYFSWFGGSAWHGRIYSSSRFGVVFRPPRIYFGVFGSGFFQSLYAAHPETAMMFFTSLEYHALIVWPLCVLAVAFNFLIPLALTGLMLPLGICAAAAIQAQLPPKKRRFWSRPLVAMLFFLQPLARGWARYQGRLSLRSKSLLEYESLDSLSLRDQGGGFNEAQYAVGRTVDRLGFLNCVLARLNQQGWEYKPDEGWRNFDVEITGDRWSRLQLITVMETYQKENFLIRCRLRKAWTLLAKIVFFSALGAELLLVGFWGPLVAWHWLTLLSLGGLAWWLRWRCQNLQRLMVVFLDEAAKSLHLTKVECPK